MQYHTIPLQDVSLGGELRRRAMMTLDRFAQPDFAPESEKTYRHKGYEWPGDNEGRLLLAHILLARCTHQTSRWFAEIFAALPQHLNPKGYLGEILSGGFVSEQQIAGNSWLLRALLEHYDWTQSADTRARIDQIVDNFLLPLADIIHTYPSSKEVSGYKGEAEGSLIRKPYGKWYMSTDFGCLFIALDGATQAYALRRDEKLRYLIETMMAQFCKLDVRELSFQTHATLTCMRAFFRYSTLTNDAALLEKVKEYYALYRAEGMTAAYTNYNWFNIPEFTEPCAVIDSFILAVSLWNATGDAAYLNDAHLIWYNGVYSGQRLNGGFGCDTCAGVAADCMVPSDENYEAWWCCSKRGAEFFSTAAAYLCAVQGDTVVLPLYESMTAQVTVNNSKLLVRETAEFDRMGAVCLEILQTDAERELGFAFFVPDYLADEQITLYRNGKEQALVRKNGFAHLRFHPVAGDVIELRFAFVPRVQKAHGLHTLPNRSVVFHGPCLLGTRLTQNAPLLPAKQLDSLHYEGGGVYTAPCGAVLRPLQESTWLTKGNLLQTKFQLTFAAECEAAQRTEDQA